MKLAIALYATAVVALVGMATCAQKQQAVVAAPLEAATYVIGPDVPGTDRICIVLPPAADVDPSAVGVHCITIGSLRAWLAHQLRAE